MDGLFVVVNFGTKIALKSGIESQLHVKIQNLRNCLNEHCCILKLNFVDSTNLEKGGIGGKINWEPDLKVNKNFATKTNQIYA